MRCNSPSTHGRGIRLVCGMLIAAALTLTSAATAATKVNLLSGPLKPDHGGHAGEYRSEVKMLKGKPVLVNFIELEWPEYECSGGGWEPFRAEVLFIQFDAAKVKKQDGKYVFSTSGGSTDTMSGTVAPNGLRLRGTAHSQTAIDERPGAVCVADLHFKAKSIYLKR